MKYTERGHVKTKRERQEEMRRARLEEIKYRCSMCNETKLSTRQWVYQLSELICLKCYRFYGRRPKTKHERLEEIGHVCPICGKFKARVATWTFVLGEPICRQCYNATKPEGTRRYYEADGDTLPFKPTGFERDHNEI